MKQSTCPHCGNIVVGTKIKCGSCGQILSAPPPPDKIDRGGKTVMRGQDSRTGVSVRAGTKHVADFSVDSGNKRVINITDKVQAFVRGVGESGLVHVFVPHATAGVAIMEVGSGSEADLGEALDRLFPSDDRYAHKHGSKGHGRSHVVPVMVAPFTMVPVDHGNLLLGKWQSIVVVDPNEDNVERRVLLTFLPGRR
jgi:secondary thiamine-phosphate synthase enzyme